MNNLNNNHQNPTRKGSSIPVQKDYQQNMSRNCQGERSIYQIIEFILSQSVKIGSQNIKIASLLEIFSQDRAVNNISQLNDLFEYRIFVPNNKDKFKDSQPKPLLIDSLLPISADIDQERKKYNNPSLGSISQIRSRATFTSRQTPNVQQIYTKLDLPEPQQEDGFTKQLRKIQQEKHAKRQNERKQKQKKQKIRLEKLKDKKNNKNEEVFSYGYNGQVLEVRLQSKNNLVSKIINGNTDIKMKINKQAFNDPNPTKLVGVKPGKKDTKLLLNLNNSFASQKSKAEVEFSDVKSLAQNIKTNNGIKYTYQGKTYEQKKRVMNVKQLKKTLSQRRLSKQQFGKIRNSQGNREQVQEIMKSRVKQGSQNMQNAQRAKSQQSRASQSSFVNKKNFIRVTSKNLKQKLLQKDLKAPPEEKRNQENLNEQSKQKSFGMIDNYNMEYIRTGGSLYTQTSKQFFSARNELPKIPHNTVYSKAFPKGRQRVKNSNEIIRDLRKKFEEKLRV